MIIKKIFLKENDSEGEIHREFLKFGKGEYRRRYQIQVKKQGEQTIIRSGNEFTNYFVKRCLEKVHGDIDVTGVVVSTFDFKKDHAPFPIERTKNFMGIRQLVINSKLNPQKVLEFMKKYPTVFFALSFKTENFELKIKPKAPKSAKPSTKSAADGEEEEMKVDFCTLKTQDKDLIKEFLFDVQDFKEVLVVHTIKIQEIKYPKDFAKMKPEEVREKSIRKGIVVREMDVDGKKSVKEAGFEA